MSKKFWILTPSEHSNERIFTDRFTEINKELAPKLEPHYDLKTKEQWWVLLEPWEVKYDDVIYRIPAGFITDGATIPRILWPIFGTPTDIPRLYVALLHDYLYTVGPQIDPNPKCHLRRTADKIYRDFNIQLGEPVCRTKIEYRFIRMFGGSHWRVES